MPQKKLDQDPGFPAPSIAGLPVPVLRVDSHARLLHANRASQPLLKHWGCKVQGTLPDPWKKHLTAALRTRKPRLVEQACGRRLFSIRLLPDRQGAFVDLIAHDITSHRQTEDRLRSLSLHQDAILKAVPDIVMEVNRDKVYTWANPAGLKFFGRDVIGREAAFYFEGEQQTYQTVQPLFNGDRHTIYVESWQRRRDGQKRLLAWWCHNLVDKDGNVIGALSTARDITAQREMEARLLEAQEHYRTLFEQSPDAIFTLDLNGSSIEANRAGLAMLGYSAEELHRLSFREISNEQDESRLILERLLQGEKVAPYERNFRRKDGTLVPVEAHVALIHDHQGNPWRIQSIARDITARKQAEAALLESEQRFSTIFHASPGAVALTRLADNRLVDVNNAWLEVTGFSRAEVIGHTPMELGLWVDPAQRRRMVQTIRSRRKGQHEVMVRTKPGAARDMLMSAEVIRLGGEDFLLTMAMDITARKQAQERLQHHAGQMALLVEAGKTLTQSLDLSVILQAITAAGAQVLGVETSALYLLEQELLVLQATTPPLPAAFPPALCQARPQDHPHITQALHSRAPVILADALHAELTPAEQAAVDARRLRTVIYLPLIGSESPLGVLILGTTGAPRLVPQEDLDVCRSLANLAAISIENARLYRSVINELTERARAEDKIRRLNAELEQRVEARTLDLQEARQQLVRQEKLAALGQLAGGVGHELRNPLAVINNAVYYLKLILPRSPAKVQEYLEMIEREAQNAGKIITDLLDFSRLKPVEPQPVSAADLARRVIQRFPPPDNVQVRLQFPPSLPLLFVDPRQIEQVLGNLVVNACQAMPAGGHLSLSARRSGEKVAFLVSDEGTGIAPADMPHLFEPLFTTKPRGIGLGLAVSQKLVEANDGSITVQSTPGRGSKFTVWLPACGEKHA